MAEDPKTGDQPATGDGGSAGVVDDSTAITDGVKPGEGDEALRSAQAAEEKVVADKAAEEKAAADKAAEEKAAEGAPETYTDFTVPEGVEVDAEAMTKFQGLSKELDLSQVQAQKLVDFQADFMKGFTEKNVQVWADMKTGWLTDSKADKEIGGQNFDNKVEAAKRGINMFGTPALVELLETYGLGNHPEIIRYSARVGEALGEDKITAGAAAGQPKTLAERIYGRSQAAPQ